MSEPSPNLTRLLGVMARLRHPESGCPWDLEQDHKTLRPYLLEEAYEVLEAIDAGDDTAFVEELGDLLLQIVFHARMAEERDAFRFDQVAEGIAAKLEERHPHIFGDVEVADADEVARNWEAIKAKKKKRDSVLDGVPAALPALTRAGRIQEKAASVGFDWEHPEDVAAKIAEEAQEFAAVAGKDQEAAGRELGDLLFSVVNWARKAGLEPESHLREATLRFEGRFRRMERDAPEGLRGKPLEELDALWEKAKSAEA
jgi:MazG family protein